MHRYEEIIKKLDTQLEQLESENDDVLLKAEKGVNISKDVLEQLRKSVSDKQFKSKELEIYFFKNVKPHVISKLIYYVKLFNIESKRPRGSSKSQIKYFNNEIDKLQQYFNDNLEFYQYYRRGAMFLDNQYFLRGKTDIRLHPESFHFFADNQFSTSHDSTVATILAYDMLIIHLKKEADKLINSNNMETVINPFQKQSRLFWTANKTDLVELIYALHSSKSINSGTVDIKEMAMACEHLFNIDLGDFYRTFLEIRSRKINQTKFIDNLRDSLLQKMAELDE
ncbi:MAG: RteC domain-containing protein [Flavobacteriaceae bacterium]|nr:RteC domain-containing protein [Flavobacteriaceae bacterium]